METKKNISNVQILFTLNSYYILILAVIEFKSCIIIIINIINYYSG